MRKLMFVILLAVSAPFAVAAQGADPQGQGYAFVAPGGFKYGGSNLHIGAGVEALVYKGLGIGGEIGYLAPERSQGAGFGVFSPDVSYHFVNLTKSGKVAPFATAGYSLLFRSGAVHAFNVGGGVNYWFKERIGLRFEVRHHVPVNTDLPPFYGFRIGLAFR